MPGIGSIRGDVNAILNDMVHNGVITSLETNFDNPLSTPFGLHVRVAADQIGRERDAAFDQRRRELQASIIRQIEPLVPGVIVSVRGLPRPRAATSVVPGAITADQCRAARRLLGWSQETHSHAAGISSQGVGAFERGEVVPRPETMAAIIGALEAAGVELKDGDVRLRPEALKRKRS